MKSPLNKILKYSLKNTTGLNLLIGTYSFSEQIFKLGN